MPKAVKLADIAERVGVSIVTVSKALAGKTGVSEEVREKIKEVAEELGYRPASIAKFNRIGATGNIGVLIPKRFLSQNSFYWELYQRIVGSLTSRGYYAILELLEPETEEKLEMPKMILDKKVDGIIALGQTEDPYIHMLAQSHNVPVMFLDFYNAGMEIDTVISDSFYGMYMLTNHLISMGHRNIGFVGTVLATSSITDRYFGYCKAMRENHLEVYPAWCLNDREIGGKPEDTFVNLPERLPTAFACNCDMIAYMMVGKLQERGLRVPEDISVVGYDNYSHMDPTGIPMTTYDVGMKKMAETCVDTLMKKIFAEPYYRGVQIVTGHMVVKDSVRKISE